MSESTQAMLEIVDLHGYYGKSHVLHGVNLHVNAGEIVCLLGRNGVGRSTTAKAVMGQVVAKGAVRFKGRDILGMKAYEIARLGIGLVPENRDIFPDLTVRQNLMLGVKDPRAVGRWSIDDMYALFPRLKERDGTPGGVLSGGEQQMLTLCRTMMGDPDFVMIDEPTEGLAPKIVALVGEFLQEVRKRGISILLIEQKLAIALDISERLYLMGHGRIVFEGTPADLKNNEAIRKEWLEV
ncbi:ABC transporter ATP-binding protein [Sulfuritalea sp.]|uniref:ABC transporter ATP-binding protein n=1 Tax=Sulfuritalea sp. TaxID=2480090 RepID=UPI001ACF1C26|nr:ABC transporter ATP-binding protein [Sulfuritalea sp.]MBN8475922.1 ABC transporter ATP-binding protein [Sulfuritalea sp.]